MDEPKIGDSKPCPNCDGTARVNNIAPATESSPLGGLTAGLEGPVMRVELAWRCDSCDYTEPVAS